MSKAKLELTAVDKSKKAFKSAGDNVAELVNHVKSAQASVGKLLGGAGIAAALTALGGAATKATLQWQSYAIALKAATGSSTTAANALKFVESEADRLGLTIESLAPNFAQFAAAAKDTALEGQATRDVFTALSEAASVMRLSADDTDGAMRALTQMLSKGKVQAEELRGQLGERIPGAFQIAARSMGVTTQELNKMLEQGQVFSDDFLPKFAAQLRKEMAGGLSDATTSASASFARLQNSAFKLMVAIGDSGLVSAMATVSDLISDFIDDFILAGEAADDARIYFKQWADVLTISKTQLDGVNHALEQTGVFLEILGGHALRLVIDAFKQFPINLKTAIAIGIGEFGRLVHSIGRSVDELSYFWSVLWVEMKFSLGVFVAQGKKLFFKFTDSIVSNFSELITKIADAIEKLPGFSDIAAGIRSGATQLQSFANNEAEVAKAISEATVEHGKQLELLSKADEASQEYYRLQREATDTFILDKLRERDAVIESLNAQEKAAEIARKAKGTDSEVLETKKSEAAPNSGPQIEGGVLKERDKQAEELENLKKSLMSQTELEQLNYDTRLQQLTNFNDLKLINDATYMASREQLEQSHFDNLRKLAETDYRAQAALWGKGWEGKLAVAQIASKNIFESGSKYSKKMFKLNKIAGIANAVISTSQGMAKALEWGWPMGVIAAAQIGAAGYAQIRAIKSTSFNGGGSPGAVSGGSAATTTPPISSATTVAAAGASQSQSNPFENQKLNLTVVIRDGDRRERAIETAQDLIELQREGHKIFADA